MKRPSQMPQPAPPPGGGSERRFNSPLERLFFPLRSPFDDLIHHKTSRGVLLLAAAIAALIAMNSPLQGAYLRFIETEISLRVGSWYFSEPLRLWVNDGLMGIFFLAVGLEIKRELLVGSLSSPRKAALPALAALGGMLAPAALFLMLNPSPPDSRGWGVPIATDIAFAMGALALLGERVPRALYVFLVTLAVVDDLGAVLVIAFFYTDGIYWEYLYSAMGLFCLLAGLNLTGVRHPLPFLLVGAILWFAMLKSGVHATVAGVLVAVTVPVRPKTNPRFFGEKARELITAYELRWSGDDSAATHDERHHIIRHIKRGVFLMETPLQRMLDELLMPVAFLILPIFAFVNAGVPLTMADLAREAASPVSWGVALGLIVGKFVGVSAAASLAVWTGVGQYAGRLTHRHITGAALLAGIGFTMSTFIATLGYRDEPELLATAKTSILFASATAGVLGYLFLRFLAPAAPDAKNGSDEEPPRYNEDNGAAR